MLFERTTCACENCTKCCKRQPGPLAPDDFERIRRYLQETVEQAREHFCSSPGALVRTPNGTRRVGTITPRMRKGRCVFLDDNDRCTIHAVSPFGCRMFDTHMGTAQANARSLFLAQSQAMSAEYQALRDSLPFTTAKLPKL